VVHPGKRALTDHEEFNGWMAADKTVDVRSRVRGHIDKIHFTNGQIVKKGQLLFELDPRPLEADLKQAEAKKQIFEAQKVAAVKEEARLKELLAKGGASKSQVEKAEADTLALQAQIRATDNEIKRAELELEYSKIKADIDGRISEAKLTEGNLVNAGGSDPLLTTIVSIDPIRVYFNVDERSLQHYAKTQGLDEGKPFTQLLAELKETKAPFTFALDGETGFTHKGTITFGDNRIDPATGTLQLYGTAAGKGERFVPGARVRVRIPIGQPYEAMLVPETAILADQDQRYVLIVDEQNNARRRNINLGVLTNDSMRAFQPADRLEAGEKVADWWVIVDNLQRVRINYPVDPQKPGAPPAKKSGH
jgi:RND family efflux transporter MFP subunit